MPSPPGRSGSAATVPVRVRPRAPRDRVGGRYHGPYGAALLVAVSAPPVGGEANQAVVRAVADALGVRRSAVAVRTGLSGRDKLLTVADPPPDLADRLTRLCDGAS